MGRRCRKGNAPFLNASGACLLRLKKRFIKNVYPSGQKKKFEAQSADCLTAVFCCGSSQCCRLFAMGLQNSLVTRISNAVVRTTHLTGLFTDLGIELSQLFFYRDAQSRRRLFSSIRLRFTIIGFFFLGGIAGGLLYSKVGIVALLSAALLLAIGILYDNLRLKIRLARRRCRQRKKRK
ncbi:YoaK family protein [Flavobacterium nitrogenifigens]|uniref:DUF1275 domain-containing protein n=2 Tax=Flavobacterium nitrogenifigens TaxID=1617283 RepID=A0A521F7P6_9FLAO|nr:Protein of unknown function [Flavobacterium nitrogenifigens]